MNLKVELTNMTQDSERSFTGLKKRFSNERLAGEDFLKLIEHETEERNQILCESNLEVECVMNTLNIFSEEDIKYNCYECTDCGLDNICYLCYEKCHLRRHKSSEKRSSNSKTTSIKKMKCQCAMHDHKIKESGTTGIVNQPANFSCPLNEIFSNTNLRYYYVEKDSNRCYCFYCREYCSEGEDFYFSKSSLKQVDKNNFRSPPVCYCKNVHKHYPDFQNIKCIQKILFEQLMNDDINIITIPSIVYSYSNLMTKYLSPAISKHAEIEKKIDENDYTELQKDIAQEGYINALLLIKSFITIFDNDYFLIDNTQIESIFSVRFLNKLFSTKEIVNDQFIDTKINSLFILRNDFIVPRLKSSNCYNFSDDLDNASTLHRIVYYNDLKLFFKVTGIEEKPFMELIEKIYNSIINYYEKIDEANLCNLILEYFEYINMLLNFSFLHQNLVEDWLDKCCKIMILVSSQKFTQQNELVNSLEDLIVEILTSKNDYCLYSKVWLKGKEETHDLKYCFQNDERNQRFIDTVFAFCKQIEVSTESYLSPDCFFYNFMLNKDDNYIESLKNLNESEQKHLTHEITLFLDTDYLEKQTYLSVEEIESLKSDLDKLSSIRKKFYSSLLYEDDFLEQLSVVLLGIYTNIDEFILLKFNDDKKIFYQQVIISKIGYNNVLLHILYILEDNEFLINNNKFRDRIEKLVDAVLDIFEIMINNNGFLALTFLNKTVMKLQLGGKISHHRNLKFYIVCLKTLKKTGTKANLEAFIKDLVIMEKVIDVRDI